MRPSARRRSALVTLLALSASASALTSAQLQKGTPALPLGLFRQLQKTEAASRAFPHFDHAQAGQLTFAAPESTYQAHWFDQLVSHDPDVPAPSENATFKQRYWFDATYYREGGPVILLDAGETDGAGRLPFLKKGILQILSQATGGIGIVFEHRYYGQSFPVRNLTTDSLRYLTTMQSLEDGAFFARHVKLPGLEHVNLDPMNGTTPWLYYGGSYAGAKAAFARKLFPDIWWGAIASSAVTTAILEFPEYYFPIQASAPRACIELLQNHTSVIDSLLALGNPLVTSSLKSYFGLPNLTDVDFVNTLTIPLSTWQARNWDADVGSSVFFEFCDALIKQEGDGTSEPIVDSALSSALQHLWPSWPSDPRKAFASFSSYAAYIKDEVVSLCPEGEEQEDCFGTGVLGGNGLEEAPWKSWAYQVCSEWGYFIVAAPADQPSLVSRLITSDFTSQICRQAFPRGKLNRVPNTPKVDKINMWGSFELSYPRLAFIDGSEDPWLYATPHSPYARNPNRKDTTKRPFKLIPGGVHHWDENGRLDGEVPKGIRKVHAEEVEFVQAWMDEWKGRGKWRTGPWRD